LRNYIATNKSFKGLGMKASSHFLRNIGYNSLAILDFHILDIMREHKLIKFSLKSLNIKRYLCIEKILKDFSQEIKIDLARLDLILWYIKTGTVIK
jgi:N-glycosylase/DNA lyase